MDWKEEAMAQVYVAYGCGVGPLRTPRTTVAAIRGRYFGQLESMGEATWDQEAVEILERIRAIGRLCAQTAIDRGDTEVSATDFDTSAATVEVISQTEYCPPGP